MTNNAAADPFLEQAQSLLAGWALSLVRPPLAAAPTPDPLGRPAAQSTEAPQQELLYRTLLEQIPAIIFMARLESGSGEVYVSPHVETLLGYSRDQWLDDPLRWYERIHPDDRERWSREAAALVLLGEPLRAVYRVLAHDSRVVWFQCDVRMVRKPDGEPWFLHGIAHDVSDLKEAE